MRQSRGASTLLALWEGNRFAKDFEYDTQGAPCEQVFATNLAYYPSDVQERFPEDQWLKENDIESYLAIPLYDATGNPIGHLGLMDDGPTENELRRKSLLRIFAAHAGAALGRKRLDDALRRSERNFRSLIENAEDIIQVFNMDGTIRYISPSLRRVLDDPPEEVTGKNAFEFVHPDDLPDRIRDFAKAIENPSIPVHRELRIKHKNGSWRFFEGIAINLLDDPDVAGVVISARDITERKQAQAELGARARQQPAVAKLGQNALAGTSLSALMDDAAVLVTQTLGVKYSKILELLPGGGALRLRAGVGWKEGLVGTATVRKSRDIGKSYEEIEAVPREAREGAERMRIIVSDLKTFSRADEDPRSPVDVRHVLDSSINIVANELRHPGQSRQELPERAPRGLALEHSWPASRIRFSRNPSTSPRFALS